MDIDTTILRDAGLTDGEIKVYLALLELGSTTTGPIVERSGVAKSIIYPLLDKLAKKGLVSNITKERTKYFQAANPEKLLQFMDNRSKELTEHKAKVAQLLPQLMLLQTTTPSSEAKFYLGYRGIEAAHDRLYEKLKKGEEYVYFGIPATQPEAQHTYWKHDHNRRISAGIACRLLFNADTPKETMKNRNGYKGCDARYMPQGIITPSFILVYKDTTVIFVQSPQAIAVEIINQAIADSFMAYFEMFWKRSTKFDK